MYVYVFQAWGPAFNIGGLSGADCDALVNAEPSACGDITSEGAQADASHMVALEAMWIIINYLVTRIITL